MRTLTPTLLAIVSKSTVESSEQVHPILLLCLPSTCIRATLFLCLIIHQPVVGSVLHRIVAHSISTSPSLVVTATPPPIDIHDLTSLKQAIATGIDLLPSGSQSPAQVVELPGLELVVKFGWTVWRSEFLAMNLVQKTYDYTDTYPSFISFRGGRHRFHTTPTSDGLPCHDEIARGYNGRRAR